MSRTSFPLHSEDISAFARSLASQLHGRVAAREGAPGHLELLNMLARSGGFRNFQHLRAQSEGLRRPADSGPACAPVDAGRLRRLARLFDTAGRLVRWPSRRGMESACLWAVWAWVPARRDFSEPELREVLAAAHTFGDHALLRRGLCDCGLMTRTPDGRVYRRVEARPPAEAFALLELLGRRAA